MFAKIIIMMREMEFVLAVILAAKPVLEEHQQNARLATTSSSSATENVQPVRTPNVWHVQPETIVQVAK